MEVINRELEGRNKNEIKREGEVRRRREREEKEKLWYCGTDKRERKKKITV